MGRMLAHLALVGVVLSTSLACSYTSGSQDLSWGASGTANVHLGRKIATFEITPTKVVHNDDLLKAQPFPGLDFAPDHLWMVHYTAKAEQSWLDKLLDEDVAFSELEAKFGLDGSWSGDPGFEAGIRGAGGDTVAYEECPKLDLREVAEKGEATGCVFLVSDGDNEPLERIRFRKHGRGHHELRWLVETP